MCMLGMHSCELTYVEADCHPSAEECPTGWPPSMTDNKVHTGRTHTHTHIHNIVIKKTLKFYVDFLGFVLFTNEMNIKPIKFKLTQRPIVTNRYQTLIASFLLF